MRTRIYKIAAAGAAVALLGFGLPQTVANAATGAKCNVKTFAKLYPDTFTVGWNRIRLATP